MSLYILYFGRRIILMFLYECQLVVFQFLSALWIFHRFLCFKYFLYTFQSTFSLLRLEGVLFQTDWCLYRYRRLSSFLSSQYGFFMILFVIDCCWTQQEGKLNAHFWLKCRHICTHTYVFPDPLIPWNTNNPGSQGYSKSKGVLYWLSHSLTLLLKVS